MNSSSPAMYDFSAARCLQSSPLFKRQAYVNGCWCDAINGQTLPVYSPADNQNIGSVPRFEREDVIQTISAAKAALKNWKTLLPQQRSAYLKAWHALIVSNKKTLAGLITLEQGKPLAESLGEVDYGCEFIEWFAEEAKRGFGGTIASHLPGRKLYTEYQPIGVAGLITPWNFPLAMLTRKASAALAAGCTVVAYQSSYTPFTSLALAELAHRAGIPPGVFNVVTGRGEVIGPILCESEDVGVISFTGSTQIGEKLLQQSAATIKRMCMELGGHAPFIAFPCQDMKALTAAATAAKFTTSGQDCLAANRIYVQQSIYEEFLAGFSQQVKALQVGSGFDEGVTIGPLQHQGQVNKAREHVADALQKGARLITGGQTHALRGLYYQPTVLADVNETMLIYREETFGPVAAVIPFESMEEVIAKANDTRYGLAAYIYGDSPSVCHTVADQLDYGMIAINSVKMTGAPIPFGGIKQSGFGKEGGKEGMYEFMNLKYTCTAIAV